MTLTSGSRCSTCGKQADSAYNDRPLCGPCLWAYQHERQRRGSMVGQFSVELIDAVCARDLRAMDHLLSRTDGLDVRDVHDGAPLHVGMAQTNSPTTALLIERFASACLPADGPWPAPFELPDCEDILALQTVLGSEGLDVTADRLFCLVSIEIARQRRRQFALSFAERNQHLPPKPTLEEWANAFVNTFHNNLDHLPDLADVIEECGIEVDRQQLHGLINQAIMARSHERRVERVSRAIHGDVVTRKLRIEDMDRMDGLEFEQCLCRLFRALGHQAEVTRPSGDQGADLVLEKFGERTVVQAKRYAGRVPNSAVQEAVAAKALYGCDHAMVVTNSCFTSSATELALANGVALWDRDKLASVISLAL